jgi:hypothetical protein
MLRTIPAERDLAITSKPFSPASTRPIIGARYGDRAARGTIGNAQSSLVAMPDLVAFSRAYFDQALGQPSSRSRA